MHLRRAAFSDRDAQEDEIVPAGQWTEFGYDDQARMIIDHLHRLGWGQPAALGIGAHGCDSDTEADALGDAVHRLIGVPTQVVNDAFLLPAASSRATVTRSAGLVVGTGSVAVARTAAGESLYAGGWGWLLGDPGSAWGIVRDAVRRLTIRTDSQASTESDPLLDILIERSGAPTLRDLVGMMQRRPATEWAQWAATVYAAQRAGSAAATAAVNDGAKALVDMIEALHLRGAVIEEVVAGGTVITRQPEFEEQLRDRLRRRLDLTLTMNRQEPVAGAVKIAHRLAGNN